SDTSARSTPYYNTTTVSDTQKRGVFEHVTLSPTTSTKSDPAFARAGAKLGHNKGVSVASVKDGPSKTIMISEVLGYESPLDGRGAWTCGAMGCTGFTAQNPPNSLVPDQIPICDPSIINPAKLKCSQVQTTRAFATARSAHTGGVNVSCADSNTRFISDSIDPIVWQAICSRAGGEPEQLPD
ncbi:MAG TPA: DUF1559 domain-containing protein, partial [Pirellulales bacterium]|nr:DUF1559 domain-containing protein [Pirellulales bacterium]